jgi:hypothetical protein
MDQLLDNEIVRFVQLDNCWLELKWYIFLTVIVSVSAGCKVAGALRVIRGFGAMLRMCGLEDLQG